jgi:translation elongation factor EF-G
VYSGVLAPKQALYVSSSSSSSSSSSTATERISSIFRILADEVQPLQEVISYFCCPALRQLAARHRYFVLQLHAGDIGAVIGLKLARTGDTLCSSPKHAALRGLHVPPCVFGLRLEPYSNADMPALEVGLQRLLREDPSLQLVMDNESNSVTLRGMGELHLEVALHRLCKDFGCKVLLAALMHPEMKNFKY